MSPPPLVAVQWEDAKVLDEATWADNKNHDYKPHIFNQVGFLLSDTAEGVILTAAWSEDLIAARDQIPRGMIRSIVYLGPIEAPIKPRRRKA